jgi:hypothetical protein
MVKMDYERKCELKKLQQFQGHRVEVSFNTHTHDNNVMVTFVYNNFDFDNGEYILCLFDSKDETLNARLEKNLITTVTNIDEDIYHDVVHIYTNNFILSITTLEEPIRLPRCNHCGNEIEYNEYWLDGAYGRLRLCEDCCLDLYPDNE